MTTDTTGPLSRARVATRLPARDLDRARGERGAWFRDSEGNLLGVGAPVR
ncbi:hypothetical protein ACWDSD_37785 [Streptomyces spiralis]